MTTDEMKRLIEQYMNQIYQFCCYLTGNRQEAEDLCQDTFVTFVEKRKNVLFKEERENKNYLLGIAANHWKNQRRKMWRRAEVNEQLEEEQWNWICSEHNIEKELLEVERKQALQKAIGTLPDSQRLVIQMMYSGDMTANEIATTLHISQNTVKSRLRLAKEKLRKSQNTQEENQQEKVQDESQKQEKVKPTDREKKEIPEKYPDETKQETNSEEKVQQVSPIPGIPYETGMPVDVSEPVTAPAKEPVGTPVQHMDFCEAESSQQEIQSSVQTQKPLSDRIDVPVNEVVPVNTVVPVTGAGLEYINGGKAYD